MVSRVSTTRPIIAVLALTVLLSGVVIGAGETRIMLSPEDERVAPSDVVEYDVVVNDAAGGVGSFDLTVSTNRSGVVRIGNATYGGDPDFSRSPEGGDEARLVATGMDTLDEGPVRIATVTVHAQRTGTVAIELAVADVGDESGESYGVTETTGRSLAVASESDGGDGGDDREDDESSGESSNAGASNGGSGDEATATASETVAGTSTSTPPPTTPTTTTTQTTTASDTGTSPGGGAGPSTDAPPTDEFPFSFGTVAIAVLALVAAGALFVRVRT